MSISVVVPTQNEEQTISQLIKSLLDQTLQPEEIIIVDGYSEDSTVQKVQDISKTNKKVKIFFRKKNVEDLEEILV